MTRINLTLSDDLLATLRDTLTGTGSLLASAVSTSALVRVALQQYLAQRDRIASLEQALQQIQLMASAPAESPLNRLAGIAIEAEEARRHA